MSVGIATGSAWALFVKCPHWTGSWSLKLVSLERVDGGDTSVPTLPGIPEEGMFEVVMFSDTTYSGVFTLDGDSSAWTVRVSDSSNDGKTDAN